MERDSGSGGTVLEKDGDVGETVLRDSVEGEKMVGRDSDCKGIVVVEGQWWGRDSVGKG